MAQHTILTDEELQPLRAQRDRHLAHADVMTAAMERTESHSAWKAFNALYLSELHNVSVLQNFLTKHGK